MSEARHDKEPFQETEIPIAPDGGWGWVVCVASFLSFVILDGALFTYGVFYVELLDYFQEGKAPTALVGSIFFGMSMFFCPFSSIMIHLWGLRKVAICGALLTSLGFACSVLAPSLQVLAFTYGFLGGTGAALMYVPSVVVVGFYFDKRRALANGITSSGAGLGVFIFSPMINYFIDIYTWKGAMLLLSGIMLHCIVLCSAYRPLKYKVQIQLEDAHMHLGKDSMSKSGDVSEYKTECDTETQSEDRLYSFNDKNKARSLADVNSFQKTNLLKSVQLKGHITTNGISSLLTKHSGKESLSYDNLKPEAVTQLSHSFDDLASLKCQQKTGLVHVQELTLRPLEKRDIFYSGSLHKLSCLSSNALKADHDVGEDLTHTTKPDRKVNNLRSTVLKLTGVHLLKNNVFLFIVAYSVLWTAHSTILTILPHFCIEKGYNHMKAATLLSLIGIANTVGRLLAGWITNFEKVDSVWVNTVALFMGGIICLVIPYTHSYVLLCVEAVLFGTGMATWTSLRPIVLVELLGIGNLTSAFGMLAMFQGFAFTIGPPIAGLLYDLTGSYKIPFLLAGSAFIMSGGLCILMNRYFINRHVSLTIKKGSNPVKTSYD